MFRPGPLQSGMVDDFIERKARARRKSISTICTRTWNRFSSTTYGVILYQEQVMQIAQVLAGYTLGGADLLRRAMGKKKPEEMAKQRETFVTGATERGVARSELRRAYSISWRNLRATDSTSRTRRRTPLLSYQTAYLKAHHTACVPVGRHERGARQHRSSGNVIKDDCRRQGVAQTGAARRQPIRLPVHRR